MKIKNNLKALFIITFLLALISFSSIYAANNKFSTNVYTRKQVQDMIVASALSYYYNTSYSDYGQKSMDGLNISGNYYSTGTFLWRNAFISPEEVSRSNYYHVDCSDFAFNTYRQTLGYDLSEYSNINAYTLFDNTVDKKMYYVYDAQQYNNIAIADAYVDAYKKFGQAWNNNFTNRVVNYTKGICKTSITCSQSNPNVTGWIINNEINPNNSDFSGHNYGEHEFVYHYLNETPLPNNPTAADVDASIAKITEVYRSIRDNLQPGDFIVIRRSAAATKDIVSGHVMLYIGSYNGQDHMLLHSSGTDYSPDPTHERNRLFKSSSIKLVTERTYIDDLIHSTYFSKENGVEKISQNYVSSFTIMRPINTICTSDTNCKLSNNQYNKVLTDTQMDNNEARASLNMGNTYKMRVEQYQYIEKSYVADSNGNSQTSKNAIDEHNSVNVGDVVTYNLLFLEKTMTEKNNNNLQKLPSMSVTATIPDGTSFVECPANCTVSADGKTLTWNFTKSNYYYDSVGNYYYKNIAYRVKVEREGKIQNDGMQITTPDNKTLKMSKLSFTAEPAFNGINQNILLDTINKFKNLVATGKINYVSSYVSPDKCSNSYTDLNNITSSVNMTEIGFIKNVYKNGFNFNLDDCSVASKIISYPKLKSAIFDQLEYPSTNNNGTAYTGDTTALVYAKRTTTSTDPVEQSLENMLVPGLYGGKFLKGNDSGDRIKFLKGFKSTQSVNLRSDLEVGDIIFKVESSNDSHSAHKYSFYLVVGVDEYGLQLARFDSSGEIIIYTDKYLKANSSAGISAYYSTYETASESDKKYNKPTSQILNELFAADLFAVFRPSKVGTTVTYNYNGATKKGVDSYVAFNTYKNLNNPITPDKDDYTVTLNNNGALSDLESEVTFEGWYSDTALTNKVVDATNLVTTDNHTINAKYVASPVTLPNTTKTGYAFNGWYNASNSKVGNGGQSYTPTKNETLSAKYTANTYTIKFDGNGATSGTMNDLSMTYDVPKELTAVGYEKTSHNFEGWSETPTGSVNFSNMDSVVNLTSTNNGTVTLYAVWAQKPRSIIEYRLDNGKNNPDNPTSYLPGESVQLKPASKTGYTFKGWYLDSQYKNPIEQITSDMEDNVTVYAKFEINDYKITYDLNGGKAQVKTDYNVETETFTLAKPEKPGYEFIGWTGSNGTTPNPNVVIEKGTTENKNYKANFKANTYTIKFNGNGATSGTMQDLAMTYDVSKKLTANTYKKFESKFLGWSLTPSGEVKYSNEEVVNNLTVTNNDIITLYAVWEEPESNEVFDNQENYIEKIMAPNTASNVEKIILLVGVAFISIGLVGLYKKKNKS